MSNQKPRTLAALNRASRALAQANNFDEVVSIRNKAVAAKVYFQSARLGLELQNQAAELRLRAERKAGEILAGLRLQGGNRRSKGHDAPLKLDDLGVSRDQSKRWQKLAHISEQEFVRYLVHAKENSIEITFVGAVKWSAKENVHGLRRRTSTMENMAKRTPRPKEDVLPRNGWVFLNEGEPVLVSQFDMQDREMVVELTHLIGEAENHRELLAQLLKPVCQGEDFQPHEEERRHIAYLLEQMARVHCQMNALLGPSGHRTLWD